jgi:hypothetical protein
MERGDRFHDPEQSEPPPPPPKAALPQGGWWHPNLMTAKERERHLAGIVVHLAVVMKMRWPGDQPPKATVAQLQIGKQSFLRCLQGFWPLQSAGSLAEQWIRTNGQEASDLLRMANSDDLPPPPAAEEVVGATLGIKAPQPALAAAGRSMEGDPGMEGGEGWDEIPF